MIRTVEIISEDICQLKCYLEPNCVSYNFNKEKETNGKHKCDLNNATYEHDNEHSGAMNEHYVYRGAEVSIQPVKVRPLSLFLFCRDYVWQDLRIVRQREILGVQNCQAVLVSIYHIALHPPGTRLYYLYSLRLSSGLKSSEYLSLAAFKLVFRIS